jgi:hypothetical protein
MVFGAVMPTPVEVEFARMAESELTLCANFFTIRDLGVTLVEPPILPAKADPCRD